MPFPNQAPTGAPAAPAMPPQQMPPPQMAPEQDQGPQTDPALQEELQARLAMLSPQELQMLQSPGVMDVLAKLLPELADAMEPGGEPGMEGPQDAEPAAQPQYSLPRSSTRLGQM